MEFRRHKVKIALCSVFFYPELLGFFESDPRILGWNLWMVPHLIILDLLIDSLRRFFIHFIHLLPDLFLTLQIPLYELLRYIDGQFLKKWFRFHCRGLLGVSVSVVFTFKNRIALLILKWVLFGEHLYCFQNTPWAVQLVKIKWLW